MEKVEDVTPPVEGAPAGGADAAAAPAVEGGPASDEAAGDKPAFYSSFFPFFSLSFFLLCLKELVEHIRHSERRHSGLPEYRRLLHSFRTVAIISW